MKQIGVRSQKRFALVSIVIVIILAIVLGLSYYLNSQRDYAGKTESITIGNLPLESSALLYIAEDQHYFDRNGLNVTIKNYDTGVATIDGIQKGEVDMAIATEFVVVGKVLQKQRISVLGIMDKSMTMYLIGRKNRGIENISDLKGKRVGLARGTIAEFYLGRFLDLHGMSMKDIALVDVAPAKWSDAISTGNVDAIIAWQPYVNQIQEGFLNETVIWQVQSDQRIFGLIVGGNDWIAKHPETISRFLKSLDQAEEYTIKHPAQAKAIVQKQFNYDGAYMASVWPNYQFSLSLDQSLILAMEDEARWMIKNNLTSENKIPDFLDYIYSDGLKTIKPESVNIIR